MSADHLKEWGSRLSAQLENFHLHITTSPQQSVTGTGLLHGAAALGRLGQNQGGGIHTARVLGARDEVVGSSGAVYHWQQLQSLHLVTFGLQQLHILLQELGCHTKQNRRRARLLHHYLNLETAEKWRSSWRTHHRPAGCLAAAAGEVSRTPSSHSCLYAETKHSAAPVKGQKTHLYSENLYRIIIIRMGKTCVSF